MKNLIALPAVVAVLLFSCATANKAHQALAGTWQLSLFPGSVKSFAELFGQRRPEISFDAAEQRISGSTGCNRLTGSYSTGRNRLTFGSNMATTRMACPDYDEQLFLNALQQVNNYRITNNQLELLNGSELVMTFTRQSR